jgi:hypothetical protein
MHGVYEASTPTMRGEGDWHLPYIDADAIDAAVLYAFEENENAPIPQIVRTVEELDAKTTTICCKISAARCARVSYLTHENKTPSVAEDLALFARLMEQAPMHASPVEHQATPDRLVQFSTMVGWANLPLHGNFVGWKQHRKMYVGEAAVSHTNAGVGMRSQLQDMEKSFGKSRSYV